MADQSGVSKAPTSSFKGTINVRVSENVSLDELRGIIGRIGGLHGCTTCGLMGIDLRLSADPVELQQLQKLPGVQSVSFGQ
jgi:hypothetical protein